MLLTAKTLNNNRTRKGDVLEKEGLGVEYSTMRSPSAIPNSSLGMARRETGGDVLAITRQRQHSTADSIYDVINQS